MLDKDAVRTAGRALLGRIDGVMGKVEWADLLELVDRLPRVRRTFITGAGRSGLVARSFAMRLMHAGLPAFIPGETNTPAAGEGDLLVAISCTGQTGMTEYVARRGDDLGMEVVVLTAEADSPVAAHADRLVVIPVPEPDIVLRAAIFEHAVSLCLDAVFNVLADRLKLDLEAFRQRHANLE